MSQLNTKLLQALQTRNQELVLPPPPPDRDIADILLNVAGTAGTVLDTPAALVRGVLGGQPLGENLSAIFNPRERITGNELLGRPRDEFSWGGLGVELILDPLNLVGVGALTEAGKAAKAIKLVSPRLAAAKVMGKTDEIVELTERLRVLKPIAEAGPKRSLLSLDVPFGPKKSLLESQAANDILYKTLGKPISKTAGAIAKPLKPYFSTDLGNPILNAMRDIGKGELRLGGLQSERLALGIKSQIDELVVKTGLKEEEIHDLFTLARETKDGIDNLEQQIIKDTEAISGVSPPKTLDEVDKQLEILKRNPAIAQTAVKIQPTGNVITDLDAAEKAVLRKVESIDTKIAKLKDMTERLKKVPEPIAQFARSFGATIDPSFLRAAAEGTPFAKRKGVIGYLHRYLTPDGIKLLEDTKFVDGLEARFGSKFTATKLKVSEEGLQKPRSRKLENELLVDINKFAKDFTGRNINFFENDPAKIAHHYYRHLKRAEIKTQLLQALMKHFMRETKRVKGGKTPKLLRLAKADITLDKIIKPYANKAARITRFGDATWPERATRKDIAKALKAAGLHKFIVNQSDYKQFQKIFNAVLGEPKDFVKELQLFDQFLNVYRSALTSFFPAFAVRNAFSGMMMNTMAGVTSFKPYSQAINLVRRGIHDSKMAAAELSAPSILREMKELSIPGTLPLKTWLATYMDKAKDIYPSYYAYLRTLYDEGNLPKALTTVATFEALSPTVKQSFKNLDLPTIDGKSFVSFIERITSDRFGGSADIIKSGTREVTSVIKLSQNASQATLAHELFHNIFRAFFPNDLKEQMLDDLFRNFTPDELEKLVGIEISKQYLKNAKPDPNGLIRYLVDNGNIPKGVLPENPNVYSQEYLNQLRELKKSLTDSITINGINKVIEQIQIVRRTVGEEFLANFTGAEFLIKGLRKLGRDAPEFQFMADDIEILIGNHKHIVDNYIKAIRSIRVGKDPKIGKFINKYMMNLSEPKYYFESDTGARYYTSPGSKGTASLAPTKSLSQFDILYRDGVIAGGQTQEIRDLLESALSTRGGKVAAGYKRAAENPIEFASRGLLHPKFAPLGYEGNQNIENVIRVAHYLDKRAKGLSHIEAVASVKKYLFDYRDLTSFEKNVMRRAFLFYTWTRKNIPLMMGSLVEHPRFMSTYLRATGHMNPDAQRRRPNWLPDSLHIGRKNGMELAMALGLPMEDLGRYDPEGQGISRSLQKVMGEMSPPLSTIAELGSGKSLFTGRNLEGGPGDRLLEESPLSRAGTSVKRLIEPAQGMTRASTLGSLLTGISVRRIDEKRSLTQNALNDLEVRLNRLWRAGRVRKIDEYTYRTVNGEKLDHDLVKKLLSTQGKLRQSLKVQE